MEFDKTISCQYCQKPTIMTGTKCCDNCWEVAERIRTMKIDLLKRIIEANRDDATIQKR